MRRILTLFLLACAVAMTAGAQRSIAKLSPWLRQLTAEQKLPTHRQGAMNATGARLQREVCVFVKITADADEVLRRYGCRSLTQVGNIHIAMVPVGELRPMAADGRVARIEARPRGEILLDTLSKCINAEAVQQGRGALLPQAFTGKGVVLGSMDIGFDLSHPNFYSSDAATYRIKRLWDMLATDTVGSRMPVGRDYTTQEELLALGHTRDGLEQTHGTHTLGIAAGSGYGSPYHGVAPETELCMVANAVSNNANLIDSTLYDRFTFATDALGFKYLFDYANSVGKPCVVTFSEGSGQDFWGYDLLYNEMIEKLLGPGRIMVAAAGNQGMMKSWFHKEPGEGSVGTFLIASKTAYCTLKSAKDFTVRLVAYGKEQNDTLLIRGSEVTHAKDSIRRYNLPGLDSLEVLAYPSCYNPLETCYDLTFYSQRSFGFQVPLSLELLDNQSDVEFWRGSVKFTENNRNARLAAGEKTHNVHSPSCLPRVISVGATSYRDSIRNKNGEWHAYWLGHEGLRAEFSSVGPTMAGAIKPDVMAPGNNIISSYSSFFKEHNPKSSDFDWEVATCDFGGRTYSWTSNSGTSSSCPAVAGAIALWLQAKPDLTPEDVMGVIRRTSRRPDASLAYPNNLYGYGEIDVYRGLLDILGLDRIEAVAREHTRATITVENGRLRIVLPQTAPSPFRLRVFTLDGRRVSDVQLPAGENRYEQPVTVLPSGIYAVQLDGLPKLSGSTLIRVRH